MLLIGEVSADREITVTLSVWDETGTTHPVRTVLDTGFTEYLTLPASAVDMLRLPFVTDRFVRLAGGVAAQIREFAAVVEWHGEARTIRVWEMESKPLIGMRLLYGSDLHAHLVDGGFATVAAL